MKSEDLERLKKWFHDYCSSFRAEDPAEQRNFAVKEFHTREVCKNIVRIGQELQLSGEDLLLAEAIALVHDVGRFPQYHAYRTFDDGISVNHAAAGARVLIERQALAMLGDEERDTVIHAVTLHNVFALPEDIDERTGRFAKLIRDADKIDILRVALEYYGQDTADRAEAVALGLPDSPGYSATVVEHLLRGSMARKADLTTLNDFKLLQLSWLYDVNFLASLRIVSERGYIDQLVALLPPDSAIVEAAGAVTTYVKQRIRSGSRGGF